MNTMKTLSLALLLVSLIVAPSFAQRSGWDHSAGNDNNQEERIEQLSVLLDLTPGQEAEIKEIITESRQRARTQREKRQANRDEVQTLVTAETLNEARLRELVHEQAELRTDKLIARHATRDRINQVLTPEQQEKQQALRKMRSQHKKTGKRNSPKAEPKAM